MKTLSDEWVQAFVDDVYTESHEDIVGLFWIVHDVRELIDDNDAVREQSLRVARALLKTGMQAGTSPYHQGGYQPWADQNPDTVIERIRSEWLELGRDPSIPDIAWFGPPA